MLWLRTCGAGGGLSRWLFGREKSGIVPRFFPLGCVTLWQNYKSNRDMEANLSGQEGGLTDFYDSGEGVSCKD